MPKPGRPSAPSTENCLGHSDGWPVIGAHVAPYVAFRDWELHLSDVSAGVGRWGVAYRHSGSASIAAPISAAGKSLTIGVSIGVGFSIGNGHVSRSFQQRFPHAGSTMREVEAVGGVAALIVLKQYSGGASVPRAARRSHSLLAIGEMASKSKSHRPSLAAGAGWTKSSLDPSSASTRSRCASHMSLTPRPYREFLMAPPESREVISPSAGESTRTLRREG